MTLNIFEVKKKILEYILNNGPSLPAHLIKVTGMSLTFTSAILSELLQERKLKLSHLRVGTSPLYYIQGQEEKLENFISNLKEPEIEAFRRLKQNKILDDETQSSVLRVALRSIEDFAIPIKNREKLYWKYHLLSDENALLSLSEGNETTQAVGVEQIRGQRIWEDIQKQQSQNNRFDESIGSNISRTNEQTNLNSLDNLAVDSLSNLPKKVQLSKTESNQISNEESTIHQSSSPPDVGSLLESQTQLRHVELVNTKEVLKESRTNIIKDKKSSVKKLSQKENFLNYAKTKISSLNLEIREVLFYNSNKVILMANSSPEFLILFTKKKRFDETEVLRDLKKYNLSGLDVQIYIGSEPSKKVLEKIESLKRIQKLEKIQEQ